MKPNPTTPTELSPIERQRKIPVQEAAALNSVSEATFRRAHPHLIQKVSKRRDAVTLGDALDLPKKKE
jgi:hypothetical protein